MIWQIAIGILTTLILTLFTRFAIVKKPESKWLSKVFKVTKNIVLWILSPDYKIAQKQKPKEFAAEEKNTEANRTRESVKIERASYIKKANLTNLILTFIMVILTYTLFIILKFDWVRNILIGVVGYRLCSRTIEINVSFVDDILNKIKLSSLSKEDRIKLAFKSLLEEVILFAGIYIFVSNNVFDALLGGLHSLILSPASFCNSNYICKFLAIYQVICTIILITLSFASYISYSDNASQKSDNPNT